MTISQARRDALLKGQTAAAQKVYTAVPILEGWPVGKIASEVQRLGSSLEYRVLHGCLAALVEAGLVIENGQREYRREAVREKPIINALKEAEMTQLKKAPAADITPPPMPHPKLTPIERLEDLSKRVALQAEQINKLAVEMIEVAIEFQAALDAKDDKLKKFKQFAAMLDSLREVEA